jgi:hypothetical protein
MHPVMNFSITWMKEPTSYTHEMLDMIKNTYVLFPILKQFMRSMRIGSMRSCVQCITIGY